MNILKYLFKDFKAVIYFFAALCISLGADILMNGHFYCFYRLIVPVLCILFILRTNDDLYDYEKDKNKKIQYLSKKQLKVLSALFSFVFLGANILIYRAQGLLCTWILIYMQFIQKAAILKLLFGALIFAFFSAMNSVGSVIIYVVGTIGFFAISCVFYLMKKR